MTPGMNFDIHVQRAESVTVLPCVGYTWKDLEWRLDDLKLDGYRVQAVIRLPEVPHD